PPASGQVYQGDCRFRREEYNRSATFLLVLGPNHVGPPGLVCRVSPPHSRRRSGGGRGVGASVRAGDPPGGPPPAARPEPLCRGWVDGRLPVGAVQLLPSRRGGAVRPGGARAAARPAGG